ncbi:WD40-repeat-containing domain protein [Panaeolus papilionaceus]|nr:WD40-repeat-containing domain protein [Panaeolus papilionaceus]
MSGAPITITADEINCLIYSYFQDSGFSHSAFALRNEGRLQNSPFFTKHIARGELIELLSKALLYLEVESHWRGDELATTCKNGFSLLTPHVCSLEPLPEKLPDDHMDVAENPPTQTPATLAAAAAASSGHTEATKPPVNGVHVYDHNNPNNESTQARQPLPIHEQVLRKQAMELSTTNDAKRKPSSSANEGPLEKRPRIGSMDMDVDSETSRSKTPPPNDIIPVSQNGVPVATAPNRPQGPGDDTDPRVVLSLSRHKSEVFVCGFNPAKPNLLASGSRDAVVLIWDLQNPPTESDQFASHSSEPVTVEIKSMQSSCDLTSLEWNPSGTLLAIGSYDSMLRICTSTGAVYFTHPQHQGPVFAARFSKSGKWLLTASLDGTTCLWDVNEKQMHRQYRFHQDCCLDVEWLTEDVFATAGADANIFIMHVDRDVPIRTFTGHRDEVNQVRVNPSGTRLASCSDDGTVIVWKINSLEPGQDDIPGLSGDQVVELKGHTHSVNIISWVVDRPPATNEWIATSSFDTTARLWDSVTGQCIYVFQDHLRPLYALKLSDDGKFMATGGADGWLHIYHIRTQARVFSWFSNAERPGIFELDWQQHEGINRIAMALECQQVAVLDVNKLNSVRAILERESGRIESS